MASSKRSQCKKATIVKASLLSCEMASTMKKTHNNVSKGDDLKMSLESGKYSESERNLSQEIVRKIKNFGRGPSLDNKYWDIKNKSDFTSEEQISTPKEALARLNNIKKHCKGIPHRPHEWLSNDGEKRLRELKERNPRLVQTKIKSLEAGDYNYKDEAETLEAKLKELNKSRKEYENEIRDIGSDPMAHRASTSG